MGKEETIRKVIRSMHVFYIDESYDGENFVMAALGLRVESWKAVLENTQGFRRSLRDKFGIKITREIHASRFIRDCSDNIASAKLNLGQRKHAFELCLRHIASLDATVRVINLCLKVPGHDLDYVHGIAIERLCNRIQRTMEKKSSHAIVVLDEGKEREITRLVRKMGAYNPIPSIFGVWPDGSPHKNITLDRIIEDPFFRASHRSYFLQMADHAAFALLKRESTPTKFIRQWGYQRLFPILAPVRFLAAHAKDPDGIIRW